MRKSLAAFLFTIAIATGTPFALAQDDGPQPTAEAESLEARVARLEHENRELKATVMRRLPEAAPAENEDKYYQVDAANTSANAVREIKDVAKNCRRRDRFEVPDQRTTTAEEHPHRHFAVRREPLH